MKDIKTAIKIENQYIKARMEDVNVILDVSSCGYDSLDDYFQDKIEYLLKKCGVKIHDEISMKNIEEITEQAILNGIPSLFIPHGEPLFAWHGDDPINIDLCNKLGVTVHEMKYHGGTIVCGEEDLEVQLIIPNSIDVNAQYFLYRLSKIIPNAIVDHNDILVNGEKILGSMERQVQGMFIFSFHLSFSDQSYIASQICTKKSTKKIGFLTDKKKQEIKQEVISWVS